MNRILVGGSSGAGKTTLARRLGSRLELPYVEVDSLFHGAGWVPRPEFVDDVDRFTAGPRWVIDDYSAVRHLVWSRIDTFVWLDYSRARCEWRVLRRSVARGSMRRELWNGNRERLWAMFTDPEHPVRWSWAHHAQRRAEFEDRVAMPEHARINVLLLTHPRQTRDWLQSLPT